MTKSNYLRNVDCVNYGDCLNKAVKQNLDFNCFGCDGKRGLLKAEKEKAVGKGETKKCSKCGKELPATVEYFWRNSHNSDGLFNDCRQCRIKYNRKRIIGRKKKKFSRKRNSVTSNCSTCRWASGCKNAKPACYEGK